MRTFLLLGLLLPLCACAEKGQSITFRNPQTGAIVHACGPYPGFAEAVAQASAGCAEGYADAGWVRVDDK